MEDAGIPESLQRPADFAIGRCFHESPTIGYTKLDLLEPATVRRLRLAIEGAAGMPQDIAVKLYNPYFVRL